MKAIQYTRVGGPEVLQYVEVPDPSPGAGEALIEVKAVGANFGDTVFRRGMISPALPTIPGMEAAGVVAQVGEGVTEVVVGDRVAYAGVSSSYAEKVVAPAWQMVKLPEGFDAEMGASLMTQGLTAHYLCRSTYPLKPGDTALIHAAAGGVGSLLTQMAKLLGARVIATVSSDAKAQFAQDMGADHAIIYTKEDFEERVKELTGGSGVQVVYDSIGQATMDKSVACLARRGYMVMYGLASGAWSDAPLSQFADRSRFLTRPNLGDHTATREELLQRTEEIFDWVRSGKIKPHIHGKYPLREAQEVHRQLEGRLTTGKLLLIP